jgi:23S rRNA pseudoU1915 N3-methylase RlmH
MESFNNSNNLNIELAKEKTKQQQFQKIKKILKCALKKLSSKKKSSKKDDRCEEEADNSFNEMLERRMEDQQNLMNEQIAGKQEATIGFCYVENEHGKFYWSAEVNQFVAVDRDLIASQFCTTARQTPQVQCC